MFWQISFEESNSAEICSRGAWKKIQLMLDSKTMWNSLIVLSNGLIDCNQELGTFDLEKKEVHVIPQLVSLLEPLKFVAENLPDRTSTLLSAEGNFSLTLSLKSYTMLSL